MVPKKNAVGMGRRTKNPEKPLQPLTINTTIKGQNQKSNKRLGLDHDAMYRRAVTYHKMKRLFLAPFIAKLLIKHRFEEFCEDLDEEMTILEMRRLSENGSRRELTLGMVTAEDSANDDYQDDWRKENGGGEDGHGSESD